MQGVIAAINAATGGAVTASLNAAGTGVRLTDDTGGTGTLSAADADGTDSATALGLTGSAVDGTLGGKDLDRQWLTGSTLLSSLNGGQGIGDGTFTVTTAAGAAATVTVGSGVTTVAQLLYQINSKGVAGLTASVNATGDGIQIDDASGGAGQLTVADATGTAAADLNLAGTAAVGSTSIDGAYAKTVTLGANDTLTSAAAAINAADAGVTATIISGVEHQPVPAVDHGQPLRFGRWRHVRRRHDRADRPDAGGRPGRGRVRRRVVVQRQQRRGHGPAAAGHEHDQHRLGRHPGRDAEPAQRQRRHRQPDRGGRPRRPGQVARLVHDHVQHVELEHQLPVDVQHEQPERRPAAGATRSRWASRAASSPC